MTETAMQPLPKYDARMPVVGSGKKVLKGAYLPSWRHVGLLAGFLSLPVAGEQGVSSQVTAMGEASRIHALLVGVDFYQDRRWRQIDLEGPANDVLMIARKLIGLGVSSKRIVALVSDEPSDAVARELNRLARDLNRSGPPTRKRILAELRRMADDAGPGKTYLFLFSGHGKRFQMEGTNCYTLSPGEATRSDTHHALVAMDANVSPSCKGLVADEEVKTIADRIIAKGGRFVAVIDACFAGTFNQALNDQEYVVLRNKATCSCGRAKNRSGNDLTIGGKPVPDRLVRSDHVDPRNAGFGETKGAVQSVGMGSWKYLALLAAPDSQTAEENCLPFLAEYGNRPKCHGYLAYSVLSTLGKTYRDLGEWKDDIDRVYAQNGKTDRDNRPWISYR
jgi:hypothetical protein